MRRLFDLVSFIHEKRNSNTDALSGELRIMFLYLIERCSQVTLTNEPDRCYWTLDKKGIFSVKSYAALITKQVVFPFRHFWKVKLPLKIKVFMWLVHRNSILTRDNLLHGGWKGPNGCVFLS